MELINLNFISNCFSYSFNFYIKEPYYNFIYDFNKRESILPKFLFFILLLLYVYLIDKINLKALFPGIIPCLSLFLIIIYKQNQEYNSQQLTYKLLCYHT